MEPSFTQHNIYTVQKKIFKFIFKSTNDEKENKVIPAIFSLNLTYLYTIIIGPSFTQHNLYCTKKI